MIGMERYTEALSQLTASLAISMEIGHVALKAQVTDSIPRRRSGTSAVMTKPWTIIGKP